MILSIRLSNFIFSKIFEILYKRKFGYFGKNTRIVNPIAIESPNNIYIGDGVYVASQTCLAARPSNSPDRFTLTIKSGCKIGRFNHIYATGNVTICENVLTANGVYISDNQHNYNDVNQAILDQPILQNKHVSIGSGTWVGHNACIMGVNIGINCVIGANAVVTHDIPDFCVVVGAPARIIKRYDQDLKTWRRVDSSGEFI